MVRLLQQNWARLSWSRIFLTLINAYKLSFSRASRAIHSISLTTITQSNSSQLCSKYYSRSFKYLSIRLHIKYFNKVISVQRNNNFFHLNPLQIEMFAMEAIPSKVSNFGAIKMFPGENLQSPSGPPSVSYRRIWGVKVKARKLVLITSNSKYGRIYLIKKCKK